MTNTERIQANNADLREAIEMAESLPDAGECREPTMDDLFLRVTLNEDGTYTPSYTEVVNTYQTNGELPYIILEDYTIPLVACAMDFQDHTEYPTMVFVRVVDENTGELASYRLKYNNTWTMEAISGIEVLPITLDYGNNTFEPDYYTVGMALQDAMGGNGNKYPVIVNDIFGDGNPCIFCGVDMDSFPVFCSLEPAENEETGEPTHLRFAYVLRSDNTFVYTMLGDLRNILNADASRFAGGDQVLKGYDYIDINTGDIKEGTYEPPEPEDLSDVLTEQDSLIDLIDEALIGKASGGGITPSGTLEITENGEYDVTNYAKASVDVPVPDGYIKPEGTKSITSNGSHDVTAYASVDVNVPTPVPVIQSLNVTENGTYTVPDGVDGYSPVVVNVAGSGGGDPKALLDAALSNTLTSIDSTVTSVVGYACRALSKLKTVNLPNATSIGTYAFYYCTSMTSINAPKVTSLGTYCFYNCDALKSVNFPVATAVPQHCFYSCAVLKTADFAAAKSIAASAFIYSEALATLILRRADAICTLANKNALQDTAIEDGEGYIYVPAALVASYQANSVWSTYAAKFRALEDYTVDGTITGALDETKI